MMEPPDPRSSPPDEQGRELERALVERAAEGDTAALEQLIARHLPRLRAFVRLRLGPRLAAKESASDIVQSACRDVLGRLDQFRYGGEAAIRNLLPRALARLADEAIDPDG